MLKKIILVIVFVLLILIVDIAITLLYPDVSVLKKHNPKTTAFMEYRKKQWADDGLSKKLNKRWVPLRKISPFLVKAVIISEDDKFWRHEGFDFTAMQKALEKDIAQKKLKAGGSTISQQLAKNLYLSPSKNPIRKVKEAILTWRLEQVLSKKRIVEIYLNIAEWGDGIFGIEAAAMHYYGKHAVSLSPQEAVRLASVLPNPIIFNPLDRSRFVTSHSAAIFRIMIRRGIVIPEYEEVMSAPEEKTEETPVDILGEDPAPSVTGSPEKPAVEPLQTVEKQDADDTSQEKAPPVETGAHNDEQPAKEGE